MVRVALGALADLPDGRGVAVSARGRALAVFRVGDRVYALDDRCSHRGFPLSEGRLTDDGWVSCRTHGACFDPASGAVRRGPARRPVRSHRVDVVDGQVIVELDDGC
jgi:3-phenylpropionate/trans-cinnamate dioxygenase ferredoxin component